MKDLIKKTIARLKREKIKPFPKWKFALREVAYWALIFGAAFFGAVALATGAYLLFQIDWDTSRYARRGFLNLFFYIPYVWLLATAVSLGAVFYVIRKTKEGYRYKWAVVTFSSSALVLALGTIAHFAKIGEVTDEFAYRSMPFYKNITPGMDRMWRMAGDGFLAGEIIFARNGELNIVDLDGKEWKVTISSKTLLHGAPELRKGDLIKIVGYVKNGNVFEATMIKSGFGPMRMRGFGGGQRGMHGNGNMMRGMWR